MPTKVSLIVLCVVAVSLFIANILRDNQINAMQTALDKARTNSLQQCDLLRVYSYRHGSIWIPESGVEGKAAWQRIGRVITTEDVLARCNGGERGK